MTNGFAINFFVFSSIFPISELKMADGPDDKLISFPISEVAAKPGDALMKCVKKYSKQEQCMTCVGKESAGGHVQQQLTKLIAHDHIIWTQVNATVVDCRGEIIFTGIFIFTSFVQINCLFFRLQRSIECNTVRCDAHAK